MILEREYCNIEGTCDDLLIVLVGGIHGNEKEGVLAIQHICKVLKQRQITPNGQLVCLTGNIQALKAGKRYLQYDLNRCWHQEHIEALMAKSSRKHQAEDIELLALLEKVQTLAKLPHRQKFLIDLHTTSGDNGIFIIKSGNAPLHPITQAMHLPIIVNVQDYLKGTLLHYAQSLNFESFAFEGGQIGSDKAVDMLSHGAWQAMINAGMIPNEPLEDDPLHYQHLVSKSHQPHPEKVRIIYRHEVHPHDLFRMKPGFCNFQEVDAGEALAIDKNGEVQTPVAGRVFLPLYQNIGEDGFFIVEDVIE